MRVVVSAVISFTLLITLLWVGAWWFSPRPIFVASVDDIHYPPPLPDREQPGFPLHPRSTVIPPPPKRPSLPPAPPTRPFFVPAPPVFELPSGEKNLIKLSPPDCYPTIQVEPDGSLSSCGQEILIIHPHDPVAA